MDAALSHRVLGLIPAKGGSTRFPRKNIARLAGRTLLEWTADAARSSGIIDRLVLSTEDEAVAAMGRAAGIEVPFLRPAELARDPAGVAQVALHALDALEATNARFSTLVILLPTCPLRTGSDVRAAYKLFIAKDRPFVMSVSEYSHTPFAALRMDEEGALDPWFPAYHGRKSQEMPRAYRANGAIHVLDVEKFREARTYFGRPLVGYVMPRERSIDIDTPADLAEAEALLRSADPASPD
jgi:CMP-N-acetylneuraminic acid synthetase